MEAVRPLPLPFCSDRPGRSFFSFLFFILRFYFRISWLSCLRLVFSNDMKVVAKYHFLRSSCLRTIECVLGQASLDSRPASNLTKVTRFVQHSAQAAVYCSTIPIRILEPRNSGPVSASLALQRRESHFRSVGQWMRFALAKSPNFQLNFKVQCVPRIYSTPPLTVTYFLSHCNNCLP